MNILVYIALFVLFLILSPFVVLFLFVSLDSLLRGHDLPTSKRTMRHLVKIISQYKPEATNFYDLGCGRGTVVLGVKGRLQHLKVHGIDNNSVRVFVAKLKAMLLRREVRFTKQDIFKTNLRDADIVYTYLWYDLMPPLEKKLQAELRKGAVVITNTSNFPNWKPVKKVITCPKVTKLPDFETLFVYIKN